MAVDLTRELPFWFRPILEFQELLAAEEITMATAESDMQNVYNNFYVQTCDETTLAALEKQFGIVYKYGDTIEYRRSRVLQKYNTIVPFTIGFLNDRLTELYGADGYEISVDSAACTLTIKVTSDIYGAVDLLYDLLWDVVPAHIQIIANQETTSYVQGKIYAAGITSRAQYQTIGG